MVYKNEANCVEEFELRLDGMRSELIPFSRAFLRTYSGIIEAVRQLFFVGLIYYGHSYKFWKPQSVTLRMLDRDIRLVKPESWRELYLSAKNNY